MTDKADFDAFDPDKASISNTDLLKHKALTVRLFRKKPSRNKLDKLLSEELAKNKNVTDKTGLRVNKTLFSRATTDPFMKVISEAGKYYYRVTTPWDDKGFRLLSIEVFKDFSKTMKSYTSKFREAALAFIDGIEADMNLMRDTLGEAFNRNDYDYLFLSNGQIDRDAILKQFQLEVEYGTVADGDDLRASLTDEDRDIIAAHITQKNNEKFAAAQKHIITTLHEHILAIHERLCKSENIFRDTLIGNLEDLCDLIPKMNIAGDPAINQLAIDAKATLCKWDAQTLRDDDTLRADVADEANKILDNMKGII